MAPYLRRHIPLSTPLRTGRRLISLRHVSALVSMDLLVSFTFHRTILVVPMAPVNAKSLKMFSISWVSALSMLPYGKELLLVLRNVSLDLPLNHQGKRFVLS